MEWFFFIIFLCFATSYTLLRVVKPERPLDYFFYLMLVSGALLGLNMGFNWAKVAINTPERVLRGI